MLRISLPYLIYKPYNHIDRTVFIEDSFACKCMFPQTHLIELTCYPVYLVACFALLRLGRISKNFLQGFVRPQIRVQEQIFDLPRLITTWKPVRRCLSLHFYLSFGSWFYFSCSDGQPMKTLLETDHLRSPCCPFRWTKHADSGNEIVCDGKTQYLCARAVAYTPCNDLWKANVLICGQWVWYEILNSASWPFSFIVLFIYFFSFSTSVYLSLTEGLWEPFF